jgi:hypothetical protein
MAEDTVYYTPDTNVYLSTDYFFRQPIPVVNQPAPGTEIRVQFISGNEGGAYIILGASIGARSGSTPDYAGAPTRITFNDGDNNITIPTGEQTAWSDWVEYTLDGETEILIHTQLDSPSQTLRKASYIADMYFSGTSTDYTMTEDVTASTLGYWYGITALASRTAGGSAVPVLMQQYRRRRYYRKPSSGLWLPRRG